MERVEGMMTRHWLAAYATPQAEVGTMTVVIEKPHSTVVSSALWLAATQIVKVNRTSAALLALTPLSDEPDDAFFPKDRP